MAVHFIGFKKDVARFEYAVRFFGPPDFVHYRWDVRAKQEIAPGDIAIFATGSEKDVPSEHSYDDSAFQ